MTARNCICALLMAISVAMLGLLPVGAQAQEHDHGGGERVVVLAPRAEARIGNQEVVITYVAGALTVYLQRYVDGVPTTGADIELTVDFIPGTLTEIAPGIYEGRDWSLSTGRTDIEMLLSIDGREETATIPLTIASSSGARITAPIAVPVVTVPGFVFAAAAGAIYLTVTVLFVLRRRRKAMAAAA
jgi:hypothetical protein